MDSLLHKAVHENKVLAPQTRAQYLRRIDEYIAFLTTMVGTKAVDPKSWTKQSARDFHNYLLGKQSVGTANQAIYVLRFAAKFAGEELQDTWLAKFPVFELPEAEDNDRVPLTHEEGYKLISATRGNSGPCFRDRAILVVGLETGMRRKSLVSMEWERFSKTPDGITFVDVAVKGRAGKARLDVPLSETAQLALSPWRRWCESRGVSKGHVFRSLGRGNKIGTRGLSVDAIYDIVKKRAAEAGLSDDIITHELRYSFVTWRQEANVSASAISHVTGHVLPGESKVMLGYGGLAAARPALEATPPWLKTLVEQLCL